MATLVIAHPKHGRMEYPLIAKTVTIGRMNDNTIQVRDDSVSGRHARITRQEGRFHLEDLGSANRCFLEGKEVSEVDLTRDCTLRFGNVICEFQLHGTVSDSILDQFSHFQKQIQSILADRDEALRKRSVAIAERDQMKQELEALLAKRQDSGKHVPGVLQKLATTKIRVEELACAPRSLSEPGKNQASQLDHGNQKNLLQRSEQQHASEQPENPAAKVFDAISGELREAKADAAALRIESTELKCRTEILARKIESLTAQRDELQRANHELSAQLLENTQQSDWLKRHYKKIAPQLDASKTELQQLISGAENVISSFDRLAKSLSGTELFPSGPTIPSFSSTLSSSPEIDTISTKRSPQPARKFAPPAETLASERSPRNAELKSIPAPPPSASARIIPAPQTDVATGASSNVEGTNMPSIVVDPSPAISPAVLAGRGFTPGWRDVIYPLVADMRRLFLSFAENRGDLSPLDEILRDAYNVTQRAASIDSNALFNLASALEALIRDVHHAPNRITESVLDTIAEALDLLELMLNEKYFRQAAQLPEGRTCVIEDDIEIRDAVLGAMKTVNLEPLWSPKLSQTRSIVKSRPLDLILIDRTCQLKDRQDPISLIRGMPMHANTPIIAIQEAGSPVMESTQAISKPFNQRELAVKSLTLIFKGQLGVA